MCIVKVCCVCNVYIARKGIRKAQHDMSGCSSTITVSQYENSTICCIVALVKALPLQGSFRVELDWHNVHCILWTVHHIVKVIPPAGKWGSRDHRGRTEQHTEAIINQVRRIFCKNQLGFETRDDSSTAAKALYFFRTSWHLRSIGGTQILFKQPHPARLAHFSRQSLRRHVDTWAYKNGCKF